MSVPDLWIVAVFMVTLADCALIWCALLRDGRARQRGECECLRTGSCGTLPPLTRQDGSWAAPVQSPHERPFCPCATGFAAKVAGLLGVIRPGNQAPAEPIGTSEAS